MRYFSSVTSPDQKADYAVPNVWPLCLVAVLITWGGFLRFFDLGAQSLWIDEAFSLSHAFSILDHGYPFLPDGTTTWSYFPAHYLMALGLSIFRDVHLGSRFFPALAGTALIPAFYYFNLLLSRSRLHGLLATSILTFLTFEVAWSRQARMYVLIQLWIVLALLSFYLFIKSGLCRHLLAATVFMFLAVTTGRAGYLVPVVIFGSGIAGMGKMGLWREWIRQHRTVALLLSVLSIAPLLLLLSPATNSGIFRTIDEMRHGPPVNYSTAYIRFFATQFGLYLLPLLLGVAVAAFRSPRLSLPLLAAVLCYLYVLCFRTSLFHHRYLLPIFPFMASFCGWGLAALFKPVLRPASSRRRLLAAILVLPILLAAVTVDFTAIPRPDYYLGPTAPQPEWRAAYQMVERLSAGTTDKDTALVTISAFPILHDIYLGSSRGKKYFLPFSFSGIPGEFEERPRYSRAEVVTSLGAMLSLEGFVILDSFALRMLRDDNVADFLMDYRPLRVIKGYRSANVYIWRLQKNRLERFMKSWKGGAGMNSSPDIHTIKSPLDTL